MDSWKRSLLLIAITGLLSRTLRPFRSSFRALIVFVHVLLMVVMINYVVAATGNCRACRFYETSMMMMIIIILLNTNKIIIRMVIFMVLSSWQATSRVHSVHVMNMELRQCAKRPPTPSPGQTTRAVSPPVGCP